MGGAGSGRTPSEETLIARSVQQQVPFQNDMFLPNYSGVQKAALRTSAPIGGGGGTPGGADTQVQFNDGGAFNGEAALVYDKINDKLTASNLTVTGSTSLAGASSTNPLQPTSNDQTSLGTSSNQWSDLFLAEGGVINWDNGDATITQSGNTVTVAGATFAVPDDAYGAGWDGSNDVPTKNAVYDKIQTLTSAPLTAFSAYLSSDQTLTANGWTKIACNTENYDLAGWYDNTTNYRYTPQVAGIYQVSWNVTYYSNTVAGSEYSTAVYKNGTIYHGGQDIISSAAAYCASQGTTLVSLNGSTDYIEFFGYNGAAATSCKAVGNSVITFFEACYIGALA